MLNTKVDHFYLSLWGDDSITSSCSCNVMQNLFGIHVQYIKLLSQPTSHQAKEFNKITIFNRQIWNRLLVHWLFPHLSLSPQSIGTNLPDQLQLPNSPPRPHPVIWPVPLTSNIIILKGTVPPPERDVSLTYLALLFLEMECRKMQIKQVLGNIYSSWFVKTKQKWNAMWIPKLHISILHMREKHIVHTIYVPHMLI